VLIQLWEYSILTSQKDIENAKKIIYQLEEQIENSRKRVMWITMNNNFENLITCYKEFSDKIRFSSDV